MFGYNKSLCPSIPSYYENSKIHVLTPSCFQTSIIVVVVLRPCQSQNSIASNISEHATSDVRENKQPVFISILLDVLINLIDFSLFFICKYLIQIQLYFHAIIHHYINKCFIHYWFWGANLEFGAPSALSLSSKILGNQHYYWSRFLFCLVQMTSAMDAAAKQKLDGDTKQEMHVQIYLPTSLMSLRYFGIHSLIQIMTHPVNYFMIIHSIN